MDHNRRRVQHPHGRFPFSWLDFEEMVGIRDLALLGTGGKIQHRDHEVVMHYGGKGDEYTVQ